MLKRCQLVSSTWFVVGFWSCKEMTSEIMKEADVRVNDIHGSDESVSQMLWYLSDARITGACVV